MDNNIIKLAVDSYRGVAAGNYSVRDNMETLRQAFIEANNGKDHLDPRDIRDGKCADLFALTEVIIQKVSEEGFTGNELFMSLVENRNKALGDSDVFHVEDNTLFTVANIAEGVQGVRRQKIEGGEDIQIKTSLRAVKVYEELNRLMSGRVSMNDFIDRVGKSFTQADINEIYVAFAAAMKAIEEPYSVTGSFDASKLIDIIDHVEAANGTKATIFGTRAALRKITDIAVSDEAKSDFYNMGYYGKFAGTPVVRMDQRHKINSNEFLLPNDKLYVFAGGDRFIKRVTEGDTFVNLSGMYDKQDLTQEYLVMQRSGIGVVMASKVGVFTIS